MAVRIDIPGIGTVNAENAATESTLQELTRVLGRSTGQQVRFNQDVQNSFTRLGDYARTSANQIGQVGVSTRSALNSIAQQSDELSKVQLSAFEKFRYTSRSLDVVNTSFNNLISTVTEATVSFARNYRQVAENPVEAGAKLINKAIGLVTDSASGASEAFGKVFSNVPGLGLLTSSIGKLGSGVVQLFGTGLQTVNEILSDELQRTIQQFRAMSIAGASFASGMTEFRRYAYTAGLTLDVLTKGLLSARSAIAAFGEGFSGGSQRVVDVMNEMARSSDSLSSGRTFREQLIALGISYEEQIELAAEYMANVRAGMSADQFARHSAKRDMGLLAQETRDYAVNLKILSDISGKDARQAMERARLEAARADVMAKISGPAGIQALGALEQIAPDAIKSAILQQFSVGEITDPNMLILINNVSGLAEEFRSVSGILGDTSLTPEQAQDAMTEGLARIARLIEEEQRRPGSFLAQLGRTERALAPFGGAGLMGIIEAAAGMAGFKLNAGQTGEIRDKTQQQMDSMDELTTAYVKMTEDAMKVAVSMEQLATKGLPFYAKMISVVNGSMLVLVDTLVGLATGDYKIEDIMKDIGKFGENQLKKIFPDELFPNGPPEGIQKFLPDLIEEFRNIQKSNAEATVDQQGLDLALVKAGYSQAIDSNISELVQTAEMRYNRGNREYAEMFKATESNITKTLENRVVREESEQWQQMLALLRRVAESQEKTAEAAIDQNDIARSQQLFSV